LDPHGDLAEAVLMHVRRKRTNDFVYINPADAARPIGFNPLSSVPEDLKPLVADDVVGAFKHVWPDTPTPFAARSTGTLRFAGAPRPGLLPPPKQKAQINPGLSSQLDENRGSRQSV
jgi:hypothetical protein